MEWVSDLEPAAFWTVVSGIIALAGAVGAVISFALNKWFAIRNRPESDWSVEFFARVDDSSARNDPLDNPIVEITGHIANTGDAAAHQVRLACGDKKMIFIVGAASEKLGIHPTATYIPLMRSGDSSRFSARIPYPQKWDGVSVEVTWIASPTRLKKTQSQSFRVSEFVERPLLGEYDRESFEMVYRDPLTGEIVDPPTEE